VRFTVTAGGFTVTATPLTSTNTGIRAPLNAIQIVPVTPALAAIGIDFVGSSPATLAPGESAGVVPKTNWNSASGASRSTPLALVDDAGAPTSATVTWTATGEWMTPITDQPGNARMMKGYLDTSTTSVTTVTVAGLPSGAYDVYVYVDGDNRSFTRTAAYRISGPGIAETTINVTDPADTNFAAAFTQAAGASGNYVKFRISGGGFTLTATPGTSTNSTLRAPVNAIQIVPAP
jgi:hypothetical protein